MSKPLWQYSAIDLQRGLADKSFTASEIMDSVLSRMHAGNPELNAVVYDYSEQAMAQATDVDKRLAKGVTPEPSKGFLSPYRSTSICKARPQPMACLYLLTTSPGN